MTAGSVKSHILSEGTLLSQSKRTKKKETTNFWLRPNSLILTPSLPLHLLFLAPFSSPFRCLSSQQGGEARLTNWTKSEWIAEGQRGAWVGALPVGRCSQQHNTRWRRPSSGVRPSRAKVTGLNRSEVNERTYLIEEGGLEKEGWGRRSSPVWKAQRGGSFLPTFNLTCRDTDKYLTGWYLMVGVTTHTYHTHHHWSDQKHVQDKLNNTMTNV